MDISEVIVRIKALLLAYRPRPFNRLSTALFREIFEYFAVPLLLPSVHNSLLRIYCPEFQLFVSMRLSVVFPKGSSLCVYLGKYALCLPVNYPVPKSYELNLFTGQLTVLKAISASRNHPGVTEFDGFVYVFGGISKASPLFCEKFSVHRKEWRVIPHEIQPQHLFSPCTYRSEIYLSCVNAQIEVFSPKTGEFRSVFLACSYAYEESVSYLLEDNLHILTSDGTLMKWKLKRSYTDTDHIRYTGKHVQMSLLPPVRFQGSIYYVSVESGKLLRVDLRRKEITEPTYTHYQV